MAKNARARVIFPAGSVNSDRICVAVVDDGEIIHCDAAQSVIEKSAVENVVVAEAPSGVFTLTT